MDIAKQIKHFLIDQGSSGADLARRLGVSRQNVYTAFRLNDPRLSQLEKIAGAYGYRVRVIFERAEDGGQE